jgi:hypothetical protein
MCGIVRYNGRDVFFDSMLAGLRIFFSSTKDFGCCYFLFFTAKPLYDGACTYDLYRHGVHIGYGVLDVVFGGIFGHWTFSRIYRTLLSHLDFLSSSSLSLCLLVASNAISFWSGLVDL